MFKVGRKYLLLSMGLGNDDDGITQDTVKRGPFGLFQQCFWNRYGTDFPAHRIMHNYGCLVISLITISISCLVVRKFTNDALIPFFPL